MPSQKLLDDFSFLGNWEDRYRYIIDLGQDLLPLASHEYIDKYKVSGCVSQVWLLSSSTSECISFRGDSDSHIVKGLIAILLSLYNGHSPQTCLSISASETFEKLGLGEHLTSQRSNGFHSIASRIRLEVENLLAGCQP